MRSATHTGGDAATAVDPETAAEAGSVREIDTRDLRIAVLSDAIPGRNGVGTYYDDLVQHLRRRVASVELLAAPADRDAEGIHLRMPGDPTQSIHIPPLRKVWKRVTELDPHVIVSGTPGAYGYLGMLKARRLGVPFCFGHHTEFSKLAHLYWEGRWGRLYKWIMVRWNRVLLRRASTVMVHNQSLVDPVREQGAKDVRLVGTTIPPEFVESPLRPLGNPLSTVAYVGRLAPEKELDLFLGAVGDHPDLSFTVVGEGPLRARVEEACQRHPNLEHSGWVPRERVMEVVDETDLLVLPSRYETFGTVALEAMARRRLALVSSECGITRWPGLVDGLFRIRPDESVGEAIERIRALSPEQRLAVAEQGREAAVRLNGTTVDQILGILSFAVESMDRG